MSRVNYCQRRDLGLIRVTGADARAFLHAQTTQEINDLASSETRLAAWLSAKGRVRALFDVVPCNDGFWLLTEADNVGWLAEQLRFFVLRSAVELEIITDSTVYSCCGDIDDWLAGILRMRHTNQKGCNYSKGRWNKLPNKNGNRSN